MKIGSGGTPGVGVPTQAIRLATMSAKKYILRSERVESSTNLIFSSLITLRRNFQPSNLSKLHFKAPQISGSSHGSYIQVPIVVLPAGNPSEQYLYHDIKVLILELYLVNPCVAEQKTLIVLSVDTPFTGRIASPLAIKDNGEDALIALAITVVK
ncbi:hypothetical protein E3N88_24063 [Mikania micrantha]|uniref:Uncharacterized protein n=1 Tax=Mikania micrantha TaxID=192012 RepID=A0A5N6NF26_9ASTR|nr:hypothetical protein E3N88_24063 [Mikania micrantha]